MAVQWSVCFILVVLFTGAFSQACEIDRPLEIPRITTVLVRPDPSTEISVEVATQFRLGYFEFMVNLSPNHSPKLVTRETKGLVTASYDISASGYTIKLHGNTTGSLTLNLIFKTECGLLQRYLFFDLSSPSITLESEPSFIKRAPNSEILVRPNEETEIDFEMDSNYFQQINVNVNSFRNSSGLFVSNEFYKKRLQGDFFDMETLATASPSVEDKVIYKTRVNFGPEFRDAVLQFIIDRPYGGGETHVIRYDAISLLVNFYTKQTTKPVFKVRQCNYYRSLPPTKEGNVQIFLVKATEPVCFQFIVDGNPVPEFSVNEMSGTVKTLEASSFVPETKTYHENAYYLPSIQDGEEIKLLAEIRDGDTFIHHKFILRGYTP